jgi:hypothetical protein
MDHKRKKIGRNDKCPCGSGKKFKKCHLGREAELMSVSDDQIFQEMQAKEHQRREQQGLGREIISVQHQGKRFVAVGSELHYAENWNTFHDFLADYIKKALGVDWGNEELKKDFKDKHPVLQWYQYYCEMKQKNKTGTDKIVSSPHIGASFAYLKLAENLYLLRHNVGVQTELIRRLKLDDIGNFYGAVYETDVVAYFIKAGFDIEFENELDGDKSHCEFTATHKETGRKFSVEAKVIAPKRKGIAYIIRKLNDALKKDADYERIVFIDMGKPAGNFEESKALLVQAQEQIRKHEKNPVVNDVQLPAAYVIVSNTSYWHDLQGQDFHPLAAVGEGFLISSFKDNYKDTVRNLLAAREKDKEVLDLVESMQKHRDIPSTFDGENPAVAFGEPDNENPPLVIGHKYLIPSGEGDIFGILKHVVVDESKKLVIGSYDLEGGGSKLVSCPMSDVELEAYKRHPDTFFGKVQPKGGIKDPLEFYDWVYNNYRNTPKERLLGFMKDWSNFEELKGLSQEELVQLYAEGATESATPHGKDSNAGCV